MRIEPALEETIIKSAFRSVALLLGLVCMSGLVFSQVTFESGSDVNGISMASLRGGSASDMTKANDGTSSDQNSDAAGQASSDSSVWGPEFNGQFQKLVAAAAADFASDVKDGTDGPEVDLDLSVRGNTDTCGYLEGGTIGAPVCIFEFDAGDDAQSAKRDFDNLMSHIKTLLPKWKEEEPTSKGDTRSAQFTTDRESVKCSLEWSNSSGSYTFNQYCPIKSRTGSTGCRARHPRPRR